MLFENNPVPYKWKLSKTMGCIRQQIFFTLQRKKSITKLELPVRTKWLPSFHQRYGVLATLATDSSKTENISKWNIHLNQTTWFQFYFYIVTDISCTLSNTSSVACQSVWTWTNLIFGSKVKTLHLSAHKPLPKFSGLPRQIISMVVWFSRLYLSS